MRAANKKEALSLFSFRNIPFFFILIPEFLKLLNDIFHHVFISFLLG
jgi:hypothetical protein